MRLRRATGTISNLPRGQQKVSQQYLGGTSCLGLLGGSRCLVRTPGGGWLLPAAMRQVPNPVEARASRWARRSPGKLSTFSLRAELICSSPAQIRPLLSRLPSPVSTSLLPRARLPSLSPLTLPFIFPTRRLRAAPRVSARLLGYVSPFKVCLPLPLKRLQVRLAHPSPALPRYGVPSQSRQASRLPALRDETLVGQRCQICGYEHLEDVNVIESNQIPPTDWSRSRGARKGWRGRRSKATERQRGTKRAKGCCCCVLKT